MDAEQGQALEARHLVHYKPERRAGVLSDKGLWNLQ